MKTKLSLCFALLALTSAQAQIFRSEAVRGAVLGGIAGGVIGHNSGDLRHNGWKGAAIGATAGLLIGQAIGDARAHREYRHGGYGYSGHGGYVYRSAPTVHVGIGYRHGSHFGSRWHHGHHGHRGHHGIGHFGHDWHHRSHRGFGWHLSFGRPSFAYPRSYGWGYPHAEYGDYVYRTVPAPVVVQPPQPLVMQAPVQPQAAPQQVTIINNYYNTATPMSAANGLFGR